MIPLLRKSFGCFWVLSAIITAVLSLCWIPILIAPPQKQPLLDAAMAVYIDEEAYALYAYREGIFSRSLFLSVRRTEEPDWAIETDPSLDHLFFEQDLALKSMIAYHGFNALGYGGGPKFYGGSFGLSTANVDAIPLVKEYLPALQGAKVSVSGWVEPSKSIQWIGWPFDLFEVVFDYDGASEMWVPEGTSHVIMLGSNISLQRDYAPVYYLPVGRILWKGLLFDVALPLASLLVLRVAWMNGRHALTQRWRRGRGLCLKCGYNLHGLDVLGCPECGWNRPKNKGLAEGHD